MPAEDAEFAQFITQATATEPTPVPTEVAPPAPVEEPKKEPPVEVKTEEKPVVEAKKEEPKPEEKKDDEPAWKKLVAAEKAKREAKRAAGQGDAALKAKLDAVEAKLAKYEALEKKKETDPLGALEDFGISYDRATKEYIKTLEKNPNQPAPEVTALSQKIQQLETAIQEQRREIANKAQAEAVQSFNAEIGKVLETKGSDFELVRKHPQGVDLVREIVGKHFRDTAVFDKSGNMVAPGELMAPEEACARAQGWLDEFLDNFKGTQKFVSSSVAAKPEEPKTKKVETPTISQDMRQGGTKPEPHGDEIEQLLLMKKNLESQLNANQGN